MFGFPSNSQQYVVYSPDKENKISVFTNKLLSDSITLDGRTILEKSTIGPELSKNKKLSADLHIKAVSRKHVNATIVAQIPIN